MKITHVPAFAYSQRTQHSIANNLPQLRTPGVDSFVKTSVPNFTAANTFRQSFSRIKSSVKQMSYEDREIDLGRLGILIRRIVPNIQVKNMNEADIQLQRMGYGAYFQNKIGFTGDFDVRNFGQTLFFRMPEDSLDESRLNFYANFIHEITHVLQENSSDRMTRIEWIKRLLSKAPNMFSAVQDLSIAPQVASALEQSIVIPLRQFLAKTDNLPRAIGCDVNEQVINTIYKQVTGVGLNDYIDYVFPKILIQANAAPAAQSINRFIAYSKNYIKDEHEAYKNGTDFLKEIMHYNCNTDLDLRVQVYKMLTARLQQLENIVK